MSTFNQPSSLGPGRIERGKEVPQEMGEIPERPSPGKVSPTQQGKFLGELEKKEKKKESKAVSGEKKGEETVEETDAGIFGLAGKVKSRKEVSEGEGGEEEWGEEEPGTKEGQKQPLPMAPMLPPIANEQAQLHAQAPERLQAHAEAQNIAQLRVRAILTVGAGEEAIPETELPEQVLPGSPEAPVISLEPPVRKGPSEQEVPGTPVRRGPVEEFVPGTPVKRGPPELQVPGPAVRRGPVAEHIPGTPVKRGPVEEHVPGTPVKRGPVLKQAESVEATPTEEKERVAFQKKGVAVTAQPLPIAPQPEIHVKAKEPTAEEARVAREALIELFKQTVDALSTMVTKAQTTTLVTIKQPPVFEGATLLVTEYSSAKKEYNITFGNLSPDARRLIEATSSQTQLRQALVDRGYTLHMMTIEAQPLKTSAAGVETSTPEGQRKERLFEERGREEKEPEGGLF